ncbi:MAG TPA: phosphatase PAP2 family protein, partial [Candidatus Saccharimonadales bacterium]|nr:phosphatase PAP2 family protein [Candidatus Saccharimonadales bacterium]
MSFKVIRRTAYKWPKRILKNLANQDRDSRYVFVLIAGGLIFLLATLQALSQGLFDSVERPVFQFFNGWPHLLFNPMYAVTQLGSLASLVIWCGLAWYLINRRAAKTVFAAGLAAWLLAKVAKYAVHRGRPEALLPHIHLFSHETFTGFGFPSGHSTLSAACATVLYYQVKPRYRKYLLLAVLLVGTSRMYLGAHFPFDVIGGWALGMAIGAATVLIMGTSANRLSVQRLKKILRRKGYEPHSLTFADVDARGSRPFFLEDTSGTKYFAKIFGKQEHAADWLFKIYRFFRFKNLQGEEPYLNSKRNVELEALATLWAANTGARVAKVADLVQAGSLWILMQERIDGKPLSDHKRIKDTTLVDAWRQVEKLHAGRLAHRDLRAANLLIDKQGKVWVIDFGFAEVSARPRRMYMDVAELLMSMSLVVGVERTLKAAWRIVPHDKLEAVLPYLQKAVFSGATSKLLKQNPELLDELKASLRHKLGVKEDEVEEADIVRLNTGKVVNIVILAAFLYLIVPQFKQFSGALHSLSHITPGWLVLVAISSA